jgi:cyclase
MIKKRLIGVVTVLNGWAVQSIGYKQYLPLGKPECLVENLDRWGADEILVQVIDRSTHHQGPDFQLIEKIANTNSSTPIIYAGGISTEKQAIEVIRAGADRICLDAILHNGITEVSKLAHKLGAQALIASIPMKKTSKDELYYFNYLTNKNAMFKDDLLELFSNKLISEALIIDADNEGKKDSFNFDLIDYFPVDNVPLILFGGLSSTELLNLGLSNSRVSAVAVGNFLNYSEHAIQHLKLNLGLQPIRPANYQHESWT